MNNTIPIAFTFKEDLSLTDRGYKPMVIESNYDPVTQSSNSVSASNRETWSSVTSTSTGVLGLDDDPDEGKDD